MAEGDSRFTSIFDVLPFHQVKEFVLNRLDVKSKKNCRLVCKRWEERVSEALYFNPRLSNAETAQMIEKMKKPIKKLTIRTFLNFPYPIDGYGLASVQNLFLCCGYVKVSQVRKYIRANKTKMCRENLDRLLKECKDVQSLKVWNKSLPTGTDVSFLKNILFNNLRKLEICCKAEDVFCAQLLCETFSNLTSLDIKFKYTPPKRSKSTCMDLPYTQIFQFIGRHGNTLKDINIDRNGILEIEKRGVQVKLCDLDTDAVNTLVDQLKHIQLSTFTYVGTKSDEVYPFCFEMFKAQTKLTKITIKAKQTGFWNLYPQVLEQCSDTLTYLSLGGCRNMVEGNDEIFSCSVLANCSKLEFLSLKCYDELTNIQHLPNQIKKLSLNLWRIRLTASQVEFIAREMTNLVVLDIHNNDTMNICDVLTLLLFKKLMKMPRLTHLNMPVVSSVWGEIKTWIAQSAQGCIQANHYYHYSDSWIDISTKIERRNFNSDLIVL